MMYPVAERVPAPAASTGLARAIWTSGTGRTTVRAATVAIPTRTTTETPIRMSRFVHLVLGGVGVRSIRRLRNSDNLLFAWVDVVTYSYLGLPSARRYLRATDEPGVEWQRYCCGNPILLHLSFGQQCSFLQITNGPCEVRRMRVVRHHDNGFPVGSSARMKSGSVTIALAIATRCS